LNLYTYVLGNPLKYVDPTGHNPFAALYVWVVSVSNSPDTQRDMMFIADDLAEGNYVAAVLDTVGAAIPGVTGVGKAGSKIISEVEDAGAQVINIVKEAIEEASKAAKTNFYVTPKGEAIPATIEEFNSNLSKMVEQNGKYVGESSNGPVRVRVEDAHPQNPGYSGHENPDHKVPHVHVEHRQNGTTGQWGKGDPNNKTTFPQDWLD